MQTRFILINTSHAGNVGAAARAMKVMGFDDLVLVAPRWANVLRREETIQRASGALDVLNQARIVETLDEALQGLTHLCATAMTPRDFGPPTVEPRAHFEAIAGMFVNQLLLTKEQTIQYSRGPEAQNTPKFDKNAVLDALGGSQPNPAPTAGIGFLFGCERFGMKNEDVYRCHACLRIPTNPSFGSLNLAAALQVIAYEWRLALGGFANLPVPASTAALDVCPQPARADAQQVAGLLAHLEQSLVAVGFLDPQAPKKLMPRLNQLFNRAGVTPEEVHILRGVAKAMLAASHRPKA